MHPTGKEITLISEKIIGIILFIQNQTKISQHSYKTNKQKPQQTNPPKLHLPASPTNNTIFLSCTSCIPNILPH